MSKVSVLIIGFVFLCSILWGASKEWTVLVYFAADNGLHDYALQDINELERGFPRSGPIQVIVEIDHSEEAAYAGAERYLISHDQSDEITSNRIAQLG